MERNTYCNRNANAYTGTGSDAKANSNTNTGTRSNAKANNAYTGTRNNAKANNAYSCTKATRIRGYVRNSCDVGNCIYSAKKEVKDEKKREWKENGKRIDSQ